MMKFAAIRIGLRFGGLISVLMTSVPSLAQEEEPDCVDPQAQMEMNFCAYKDYEAEDAKLNAVWKKVKVVVAQMDTDTENGANEAMNALVSAQRGWIAYRDGQCVIAGFEAYGGSMRPMLVSGCLAEMTKLRTKQLTEFLEPAAQ
jgi:uncharacterized protein YecT (DUF1311 family)